MVTRKEYYYPSASELEIEVRSDEGIKRLRFVLNSCGRRKRSPRAMVKRCWCVVPT
jgi:hypothetical protein